MKNLLKNFARFQMECPAINQNKKGYGYKYAGLDEILNTVIPILHKNGLCLVQYMEDKTIFTKLYDTETGKKIKNVVHVPDLELKGMNKAQAQGAAISYYRRYSVSCLLGLSTESEASGSQLPDKKPTGGQNNKKGPSDTQQAPPDPEKLPWLNPGTPEWNNAIKALNEGKTVEDVKEYYRISAKNQELLMTAAI